MNATTVINDVSVHVDETGELNVRIKVLTLDGAQILEGGLETQPRPDVSTVFTLPKALQAAHPVFDPGAMPNDPEALKQIITDLDFQLADCQRVAATEFQRLTSITKDLENRLNQSKTSRIQAKVNYKEKNKNITERLRMETEARNQEGLQHRVTKEALKEENRMLRNLVQGIRAGQIDIARIGELEEMMAVSRGS